MTLPVVFTANGPSGYNLTKSLRFRSSASAYLNRTFASAGNRKTYTLSLWLKRGSLDGSTNQFFFGSGVSTTAGGFYFLPTNQLEINPRVNNTNTYITTTQVFRDPSAWYHIVVALDTTQATDSNRLKLYVNGVQVTAFSTTIYPALNGDSTLNNNIAHWIGRYPEPGFPSPFDGYLAEYNFIDGQALTPSSFGETSTTTGVWIPKKYTGSYGTNGFYLPFTDTTSTSTLGTDFSGNSNTWTVNNISLTSGSTFDSMTDVPTLTSATTANYSVLNPLISTASTSFVDGNLKFTKSGTVDNQVYNTIPMSSGKWYWELNLVSVSASSNLNLGICKAPYATGTWSQTYSVLFTGAGGGYSVLYGVLGSVATFTFATNDIIGFALDMGAGTLQMFKNGTSVGTQSGVDTTTPHVIMLNAYASGEAIALNCGQQGFTYTPPTGFVALNTFNLPTPTIGATASSQANKYMNIALYTGTGSSQSITGLGFQPDWTWIKSRSGATDHGLYDAVRGVQKQLESNNTDSETTETTGLTAFGSDGFTVGALAQLNTSSATYVGWNWKANGAGSTNTAGSITSTVSANTTSGFSVVTFTTQASGTATVGHGLGVAPSMIITKLRTDASNWNVYHSSVGNTGILSLNTTSATTTNSQYWNNTSPTSSVFTVGTWYTGSLTAVAYCFAPIAGYSAFGSYTGNGSSDGPFIFTGFRPRFVLIKLSSAAGANWEIYDSARNTSNATDLLLLPSSSSAEGTFGSYPIDLLSNGFKIRGTGSGLNDSGQTLIYAAFAESPFKYANAR